MTGVFLHSWRGKNWNGKEGADALCADFEIQPEQLSGADILLASYHQESYEGSAFVLLKKDGKLYEVNGSHCSCYGLEGQWEPSEVTKAEIEHRLENGSLGRDYYPDQNIFADELKEVLKAI